MRAVEVHALYSPRARIDVSLFIQQRWKSRRSENVILERDMFLDGGRRLNVFSFMLFTDRGASRDSYVSSDKYDQICQTAADVFVRSLLSQAFLRLAD